jgi:hypothetical protein
MPALVIFRACSVTFGDHRGIRHSMEVQAVSLYEAAVLATAGVGPRDVAGAIICRSCCDISDLSSTAGKTRG